MALYYYDSCIKGVVGYIKLNKALNAIELACTLNVTLGLTVYSERSIM